MDTPKFYHPETGNEIIATPVCVVCTVESCNGYLEEINLWDVGTGVFCGGCGTELYPPSPEGMVEV